MLSKTWNQHKPTYDFVIVGSGYGGAISAARLATANLNPKPTICVLERGREWEVGQFPDALDQAITEYRSPLNPLGLYDLYNFNDIAVIKGSGLGGTSLVNANVAIIPDEETFGLSSWPSTLNRTTLLPFYDRAAQMLASTPHPRAMALPKVQALDRRAAELGMHAFALNINVNFTVDGTNAHGVPQKPCIDCGDCVSGCNVGAKNTLAMNYLPVAAANGAEIYTQNEVQWIEKLAAGGWRVHGRHVENAITSQAFTIEAQNVIVSAGSLNSTEILLRSEMHGLSVSPRLGSGFSGNGDFFGLAYNGDFRTQVLGFGNHPNSPLKPFAPGPTIVAAVKYNGGAPVTERMLIEDLSFPRCYADGSRTTFALIRGDDTDVGDEAAERQRVLKDLALGPADPDGAMEHTMFYLCMGYDDARGTMLLQTSPLEPEGHLSIEWNQAGAQPVFARLNEELRRHARSQGASFIQNPLWTMFNTKHLITAHPLGGCPVGEDYQQGAVDEFGRVFSGDGAVHDGLFVCDGSLIPSALAANPLLTISALAERSIERRIQSLQGQAYPAPKKAVAVTTVDPLEAAHATEGEMERLFQRTPTADIHVLPNSGNHQLDIAKRLVRNDRFWKGFFPRGHVLNTLSSGIFTGFKKRFFVDHGATVGVTSDTDERINARNTIEEIVLTKREGDLAPGRYILLRYVDPPWQGFYDIFRTVNDNLIVGRAYMGTYPHGQRLFTFPMTRLYRFDDMTVADHRELYATGSVPSVDQLAGVWQMETVSNANHLSNVAHLAFEKKPDGTLESRYQLFSFLDGIVTPTFLADHFQLDDFTPFHDEIRRIDKDFMVGKYITPLTPAVAAALPAMSLGLLHVEEVAGQKRVGWYYTLTREGGAELPNGSLLGPYLDVRLPPGLGMTFDEEMVGSYYEGLTSGNQGRLADLDLATAAKAPGTTRTDCSFRLRMTVDDVNEFVDGRMHEARPAGTIRFGSFAGAGPAEFTIDGSHSYFRYLVVNRDTGEAEMQYHLAFTANGRRIMLDGRKYMERSAGQGAVVRDTVEDYTTLYSRVSEQDANGTHDIGFALLKFRTFEDLQAVGNLAAFLRSFRVTGTDDATLRLQAQMRFIAFTSQFVVREYDPLNV